MTLCFYKAISINKGTNISVFVSDYLRNSHFPNTDYNSLTYINPLLNIQELFEYEKGFVTNFRNNDVNHTDSYSWCLKNS